MGEKVYIGIDPDRDKSGVAVWRNKQLMLGNASFFELFDMFQKAIVEAAVSDIEIKVIVEAGWLNPQSNRHVHHKGTRVASKIGANVGANHETGKKIVEMCEYLGLKHELKMPTSKKLNAEQFKILTKYPGTTNSEKRDAGMLVFGL